MDGFTYNGLHCSLFNIYYAPDAEHRGNAMENYEVITKEVEGRNGSYYYSNKVAQKEFELQCYGEDMTESQKSRMIRWLDRNSSGKLIFDDNPYIYYDVRPFERIETELYASYNSTVRTYSGTITIKFVACEPFGKMSIVSIDDYDNLENSTIVKAETGILETSVMPALQYAPNGATNILIYNPGTELTDCILRVQGEAGGNGVTINNTTTQQICKVTLITSTTTTTPGYDLVLDSRLGKTYLDKHPDQELMFGCHDLGYIQLAGCGDMKRDITVSYTNGSQIVTSNAAFDTTMLGLYIYLNNAWRYIAEVTNASALKLNAPMNATGSATTNMVAMNNITVSSTSAFALDKLQFEFIPYVK